MTPALELRVLGPLEVSRAGQPCAIGSPLQRRLLTALTIGAGATASTDQLISHLWGEDPPPAARNSLQSHVARLRSLVGEGAILTRPPGYALDAARVTIDAVAFERSVEHARGLLEDDPTEAAWTLRAALAEWRGAAHAEFAEDLALAEALRLENLRVDARGLLSDAYLLAGDRTEAIATLLRLQRDVPLREDVTVAAARALHAVERTTEALEMLRTYRSRLGDELGLDPGPVVVELEQQLLRGEVIEQGCLRPAATVGRPPGQLEQRTDLASSDPTPPPYAGTATLGRQREQARIERMMMAGQLVTLVGPGGVGKTRLATVVAHERFHLDEPRVAWVDLSAVTNPADVAPLIIEALGLRSPDRAAYATTASALAHFRGLVVLDNCEHVLDAIAEVVGLALTLDSQVRMLATSRERLDVAGEQVVLVAPLPVPEPQVASEQDAAVRLFQERLLATGAGAVTAAEAAQVAAAVDGLPLAIELAAARAATLPIDELLDRLGRHLDLLVGSSRRHSERHRTLSNVIAWSHDLLAERERVVLRRVAVFASSFRLADAEQVCADADVAPSDVVRAIARLVETSMVTRVGTGRYRLLEPLRLFARQQLQESPDEEATWARHRERILALVERGDVELTGPREAEVIAELEDALPDLRAVHDRAASDGDLATVARMAGRLHRFAYAQARGDLLTWGSPLADAVPTTIDPEERLRAIAASVPAEVWHDHLVEAVRRAQMYADHIDDPAGDPWSRLTLAETLADLHIMQGELHAAVAVYEKGVELARRCDHTGLTSYMLAGLAIATTFLGDRRRGARLAAEASDLARLAAAPTAISLAAYALGEALSEDEPSQALAAFEAAAVAAATVRAPFFEAIARTADVALRSRHGDPIEAFRRYRTALEIWSSTGADGMAVTTLRNLVVLLARTGADTDALTLSGGLDNIASRRSFGPEAHRLRTALGAVRQRLSEGAQAQAEEAAQSIADVAEAIRFGLSSIDRSALR